MTGKFSLVPPLTAASRWPGIGPQRHRCGHSHGRQSRIPGTSDCVRCRC